MAEFGRKNTQVVVEEPPAASLTRWLPSLIVLTVIAGFVSLAWYAYHAGTQSAKEDDLPVIEADKTPMKEKPANPGGMQFPNQDKTVFETFDSEASQQTPKVERILPAPEEPMPTGTANAAAPPQEPPIKAEQVIGQDSSPAPVTTANTESYIAKPAAAPVAPVQAEPVAPPVPAPAPEKPKPIAPPAVMAHGAQIQLGAYRSDKEARENWAKMQKKYAGLASLQSSVVKADLGAKGIYYRLRASGFSSAADAKALCAKLSSSGQACILPVH